MRTKNPECSGRQARDHTLKHNAEHSEHIECSGRQVHSHADQSTQSIQSVMGDMWETMGGKWKTRGEKWDTNVKWETTFCSHPGIAVAGQQPIIAAPAAAKGAQEAPSISSHGSAQSRGVGVLLMLGASAAGSAKQAPIGAKALSKYNVATARLSTTGQQCGRTSIEVICERLWN